MIATTLTKSGSDSLVIYMHMSSLCEVLLWGSGSATPDQLCTKKQILALLLVSCLSMAPSSYE